MRPDRVAAALREHFDVDATAVQPAAEASFNTWFRADAPGGRYALQVGAGRRIHAPSAENTEARWLAALARDTGLGAPEPIPDRRGRYGITIEGRVWSLFTWVRGRPASERQDGATVTACGRLLARLHDHAVGLGEVPAAAPAADRVGRFGGTDRLRAAGSWLADAIDHVQAAIDDLWAEPPHSPHLLHGDFGPRNVLVEGGRFRPIDFQDLAVGFAVQDVAVVVARLEPGSVPPFRAGYESVRAWPEIARAGWRALVAGRCLDVMGTAEAFPVAAIAAAFDPYAAKLRRWPGDGS